MTAQVKERMVPRVWFVGSNEQTAPQIEQSFLDTADLIEAHLDGRDYLFGGRPAFGDFGVGFQMHQASTDPTPGALLEERAPRTVAWVKRLVDSTANGEFEDWESLAPTLMPLLEQQVGGLFLPWSVANAGPRSPTARTSSRSTSRAGPDPEAAEVPCPVSCRTAPQVRGTLRSGADRRRTGIDRLSAVAGRLTG